MSDIDWKERYIDLESDRDYWRARAKAWQERYEVAMAEREPEAPETMPAALVEALKRECVGQPKDIARVMMREVFDAYAKATGEEDQRITIALRRLHEGDGARVEAFLGSLEGDG
jgi:hypothetical protein